MLPRNLPRIQLTDDVSQVVAHTTYTTITWDASPSIPANLISYNGSTSLTIEVSGLYVMTWTHLMPPQTSTGLVYGLQLTVNGQDYTGEGETINQVIPSNGNTRVNGTIVREFVVGDVLRTECYQRQTVAQSDTVGGEMNSRWTVCMVDKL